MTSFVPVDPDPTGTRAIEQAKALYAAARERGIDHDTANELVFAIMGHEPFLADESTFEDFVFAIRELDSEFSGHDHHRQGATGKTPCLDGRDTPVRVRPPPLRTP